MDQIQISLELPARVNRWLNGAFALSLVGFIALYFFPGEWRTPTEQYAADILNASVKTRIQNRSAQVWQGGSFIETRLMLLDWSGIENSSEEIEALKQIPVMNHPALPVKNSAGGAESSYTIYSGQLTRELETARAPAFAGGPEIAWKKIEFYDLYAQGKSKEHPEKVEGFVPADALVPLSSILVGNKALLHQNDFTLSAVYEYHILNILVFPLKFLALAGMVWILYIFAIAMQLAYEAAFVIITALNFIFALVTGRNNTELTEFGEQVERQRWRIAVALSGLTEVIPHVDLLASTAQSLPFSFQAVTQKTLSRFSILLRLGLIPAWILLASLLSGLAGEFFGQTAMRTVLILFSLPGLILAILGALAFLCRFCAWLFAAATGRPLALLLEIHFRILRFFSALRAIAAGWTNQPSVLLDALRTPVDFQDGVSDDSKADSELQMNLLVLVVLLFTTASLYLACWLARVSRLMGDDPFTFLALLFLTSGLFASFLLPKYYRRAEGFQKREARWLFELLLFLPGLNFLMGPIIIQYELNRYAYLKSRAS